MPSLTFKQAALRILKAEKRPMHYIDITGGIIAQRLVKTKGKTPWLSVNAYITTDIQRFGDKSYFRRVRPGVYELNPDRRPEKKESTVTLKGTYSQSSFGGVFKTIRGFADLRDLARISMSYEYDDESETGHQRAIIPDHAEEIKKFMEEGTNKFFPEIILSLRIDADRSGIRFIKGNPFSQMSSAVGVNATGATAVGGGTRPRRNEGENMEMIVDPNELEINDNLARRIDGNHRLHLAEQLINDPNNPNKYIVPFCLILLGDKEDKSDDRAEAYIFHNINHKGIPITSEHAIRIILAYEDDDNYLYESNPHLYMVRVLEKEIKTQTDGVILKLFGDEKYSRLHELAQFLDREKLVSIEDKSQLDAELKTKTQQVKSVFDWANQEGLKICGYPESLMIVCLVTHQESDRDGQNQLIKSFNEWLTGNNLIGNIRKESIETLWQVFLGAQGIKSKLPCRFHDDFWNLIHPEIIRVSRARFDSGQYADAIEAAFKELEYQVKNEFKKRTGNEIGGKDLMTQAFKLQDKRGTVPVICITNIDNESGRNFQEGFMYLAAGGMCALRNPRAHENLKDEKEEAIQAIMIASWLMTVFRESLN